METAVIALKLADLSIGVSKSLVELQRKYRTVDRTLSTTSTYCNSIHAAAINIRSWILSSSAQNPARRQHLEAVALALGAFVELMESLQKEVAALVGNHQTGRWTKFRRRAKYIWDEDYFRQYLLELQLQMTAVHFLLDATLLPVEETSINLQEVAQEVLRSSSRASSWSSGRSSIEILGTTEKILEGYSSLSGYSVGHKQGAFPHEAGAGHLPCARPAGRRWSLEKAKRMLRLFGLSPYHWEAESPFNAPEVCAEDTTEVKPAANKEIWVEGVPVLEADTFMPPSPSPVVSEKRPASAPLPEEEASSDSEIQNTQEDRGSDGTSRTQLSLVYTAPLRPSESTSQMFPRQETPRVRHLAFHRLPDAHMPLFGRIEILQALGEFFIPSQIKPDQQCCALLGLGGSGKSQIAMRFAQDHRLHYPLILWINGQSIQSVESSLLAFFALRWTPGQKSRLVRIKAVLELLRTTTARWLLIFDDVDKLTRLEQYWPQSSYGSVLLTSRNCAVADRPLMSSFEVPPFDDEEGGRAFLSMLMKPEGNLDAARRVSNKVGGFPLALEQAANFTMKNRYDLFDFARLCESSQNPPFLDIKPPFYQSSFATILGEIFGRLDQAALDLMAVISMFDHRSLSEKILCADDNLISAALSDSLHHRRNYHDSVSALHNSCLIRRDKTSSTITSHLLVRSSVLRSLDQKRAQSSFDTATRLLLDALPHLAEPLSSTKALYDVGYEMFKPHVLALAEVFDSQNKFLETQTALSVNYSFVELLQSFSQYLFGRSNFKDAKFLLDLGWKATRNDSSVCNNMFGRSCLLLCEFYVNTSSVPECSGILEDSWKVFRDPFLAREGWHDPLTALEGRSMFLLDKNTAEIAQGYQESAIARLEYRKNDIRGSAVALNKMYTALGETLGYMRQYDKASKVMRKALASADSCGTLKQALRAAALYALGNIRLAQGDFRETQRLHQECLRILEDEYPYGFFTAISLHKVGVLTHENGNSAEGIRLLKKAIAIFESLDLVERYTARSSFKLGQTIYEAGDVPFAGDTNEAMEFFGKARSLKEKVTGVRESHGDRFDYDELVIYSHR